MTACSDRLQILCYWLVAFAQVFERVLYSRMLSAAPHNRDIRWIPKQIENDYRKRLFCKVAQ